MSGSGDNSPFGKFRDRVLQRKWAHAIAEIDGTTWIKWRKQRQNPAAHGRIWRRVLLLAGEVRHFKRVREDRHVPMFSEILQPADVIKMPVRLHDRSWTLFAEMLLCPGANPSCRHWQARINQRPTPVIVSDGKHVHQQNAKTNHATRHMIKWHDVSV